MKYFLFRQLFSEPIQHLFFEVLLTKYLTCNLESDRGRGRETFLGLILTQKNENRFNFGFLFSFN